MRQWIATLLVLAAPAAGFAQDHTHTPGPAPGPGQGMPPASPSPTLAGQDAYAAIAEIVQLLEADSTTDWSRVNIEALRQHLIDMQEVTLRAQVRQTALADGAAFEVTGTGRTMSAIRRMIAAHTPMLDALPEYVATSDPVAGGARLVVHAARSGDERGVAKIRGLGFIGLLTVGAHHAQHHLALARGEVMSHGRSPRPPADQGSPPRGVRRPWDE